MKTDRAPFDDKRVREAFFLIADRQELVDGALSGAGEVGNDLFGKGYEYYAADLPQREQDLDRARALLKQAGAEKLKVTLDTSAVAAGFTEAAGIFRDQAAKAGVTIDVKMGSKDSLLERHPRLRHPGLLPLRRHAHRGPHLPAAAHRLHHQRHQVAAQGLRRPLPAGAVHRGTRRSATAVYERMQRRLYAEGGFLIWGFADWIIGTGTAV